MQFRRVLFRSLPRSLAKFDANVAVNPTDANSRVLAFGLRKEPAFDHQPHQAAIVAYQARGTVFVRWLQVLFPQIARLDHVPVPVDYTSAVVCHMFSLLRAPNRMANAAAA